MRVPAPRTMTIFLLGLLAVVALVAAPGRAAELPRAQIVLTSALSVDAEANTVTLPLHRGRTADGGSVWYILTDSSDAADAAARGLVHAPLLARAGHVQAVTQQDGILRFAAAPDFAPRRVAVPGPDGFPPSQSAPGATAPAAYSPFIRLAPGGPVLNAPIVATGDGPFDIAGHGDTADRVLAIAPDRRSVTLLLSHGFAEGRRVAYISTEASDPMAAMLERAIFVPRLNEGDADIGLLVLVNGQQGRANPQRQGLLSFARDGGLAPPASLREAPGLLAPLNILTAFPTGKTASGYSPLWSVSMAMWSAEAVAAGRNLRQTDQAAIYRLATAKLLTGPDGGALQPAGFAVNCPVVAWLDGPVP